MVNVMVSQEFRDKIVTHIRTFEHGRLWMSESTFEFHWQKHEVLFSLDFCLAAVSIYKEYNPNSSIDEKDLSLLNEHLLDSYIARVLLEREYDGDFQRLISRTSEDFDEPISLIKPESISLTTSDFGQVLHRLSESESYEDVISEGVNYLRVNRVEDKNQSSQIQLTNTKELLAYLTGFDHVRDRLVGGYKVAEGVWVDWYWMVYRLIEADLINLEQLQMRENTAMDDELTEKIEQG